MLMATEHLTRRVFVNRSGKMIGGMALSLPAMPVVGAQSNRKASDLEKILRSYYAAYEAKDLDKILSYHTEDCFFEDHTFHITYRNRQEMREAFIQAQPQFVKIEFEITNLIVSGNWIVSQHIQRATYKRDANSEPKDYSVHGVSILEFVNGKIKRQTDFYDILGFRKQVGLKS